MPRTKGFTTVNVSVELQKKLNTMAQDVAQREGLSKVSVAQLIERMIKVYENQTA